jgi:hypothetical protein
MFAEYRLGKNSQEQLSAVADRAIRVRVLKPRKVRIERAQPLLELPPSKWCPRVSVPELAPQPPDQTPKLTGDGLLGLAQWDLTPDEPKVCAMLVRTPLPETAEAKDMLDDL